MRSYEDLVKSYPNKTGAEIKKIYDNLVEQDRVAEKQRLQYQYDLVDRINKNEKYKDTFFPYLI